MYQRKSSRALGRSSDSAFTATPTKEQQRELQRYSRVDAKENAGTTGSVVKVVHLDTGKTLAIKTQPIRCPKDPNDKAYREHRIMEVLTHKHRCPNFVRLHGAVKSLDEAAAVAASAIEERGGTSDSLRSSGNKQEHRQRMNLIMEYVNTCLADYHQLPLKDYRAILFQILFALHSAQTSCQFVHNDLHLRNILVQADPYSPIPPSFVITQPATPPKPAPAPIATTPPPSPAAPVPAPSPAPVFAEPSTPVVRPEVEDAAATPQHARSRKARYSAPQRTPIPRKAKSLSVRTPSATHTQQPSTPHTDLVPIEDTTTPVTPARRSRRAVANDSHAARRARIENPRDDLRASSRAALENADPPAGASMPEPTTPSIAASVPAAPVTPAASGPTTPNATATATPMPATPMPTASTPMVDTPMPRTPMPRATGSAEMPRTPMPRTPLLRAGAPMTPTIVVLSPQRQIEPDKPMAAIYADGLDRWCVASRFTVKIADFGLSRATLDSGEVVYNVKAPWTNAFLPEEDIIKLAQEFDRVAIVEASAASSSSSAAPPRASDQRVRDADDQAPPTGVKKTEPPSALELRRDLLRQMRRGTATKKLIRHKFFDPLRVPASASF